MSSMFRKATKAQVKLRLALVGTAGSGKTITALRIASRLAELRGGGRIAVIDTEHGTSEKYAGDPNPDGGFFDFDVCPINNFGPDDYLDPMYEAVEAGYKVIIMDSITHAWTHRGGILATVDATQGSKFSSGWAKATPMHQGFIDGMLSCGADLIVTMRSKADYVLETVKGKSVPRKVGMAPVQRDGMDYEFDLVLDISAQGHVAEVTKSRVAGVEIGDRFEMPGADVAELIFAWLSDGVSPEERALQADERKRRQLSDAPSNWVDDSDQSSFFGFLSGIGIKYEDLKAYQLSRLEPKPSSAGAEARRQLAKGLENGMRAGFDAWLAARGEASA